MGSDIVVDSSRASYTIAYTYSTNFPGVTGGFQSSSHGGMETVVFKLNSTGQTIEYATYIGGSQDDFGYDIALGSDQSVYITGRTFSPDFPTTTGCYDPTHNSSQNPFVSKISPDGTELVYSTYFGEGQGHSIAVDSSGFVYVAGQTLSSGFPTTPGAYDRSKGGLWDGFIAKFSQDGSSLIYSTFIGGSGNDCEMGGDHQECAIVVNDNGEVTIAGVTRSSNYPTTIGAYDRTFGGMSDAFVLKLNAAGNGLIYSTYVGGPGEDTWTTANIVVDSLDATFVVGQTSSSNFPTTDNAFQRQVKGGLDSYVFKLSPDGSHLEYSTLLGGNGDDVIYDCALMSTGEVVVFGETRSTNFPITSLVLRDKLTCKNGNCVDTFVTLVRSDGTWLDYSTLWGGSVSEWARGITIGLDNSIYMTGMTASDDFSTTPGAFLRSKPGDSIYVSRFHLPPNFPDYSGKTLGGGGCSDPCSSTLGQTQLGIGDPVNSRTGGFNLPFTDLSFNTSAGELSFSRDYSSLTAEESSSLLGYGWTHNHDSQLIFPNTPEGVEGKVLVKLNNANLYGFTVQSDDSYLPDPGILATLTKTSNDPDEYQFITSSHDQINFDENGKITAQVNEQGREIAYAYDFYGRLEKVSTDAGARYLQLDYNSQDLIASVSDHAGRYVHFEYNGLGEMSSFTDVLGNVWSFRYDNSHRMIEAINPLNETKVRNEYDTFGRVVRQYDGNNNLVAELTFNINGSTTVTNALELREVVYHDSTSVVASQEDALGGSQTKQYDNNFRPTRITDPLGHETSLGWSADGANLNQMTDALGNQTDLIYDDLNNITGVIDPLSYMTQYFYEDTNHPTLPTRTIDASNAETVYTYTSEGYVESIAGPLGNVTRYTYDTFGQPISISVESAPDDFGVIHRIISQYTYDNLGRVIDAVEAQYEGSQNPETRITHNEYDAADHLVRAIRNYDPQRAQNEAVVTALGYTEYYNIVSSYEYDDLGRQVQVTDTFGHTTQYVYDAAGRIVNTIDASGNETVNTYDETGQLVATSDGLGHTTSFVYDEAGRLVTTTDALGHTTTTTYNLDGTVSGTTDARGNTTTYEYDSLKRVTATRDALGNVSRTTYDAAGNVATTMDALGHVVTYEYDPLNRLIKQNYPLDGGTTASIEYFYDSEGNQIQTIDLNGNPTTNYYDGLNRLIRVEDALGNGTTYEYRCNGK